VPLAERYAAALDMAAWADRIGFVSLTLSEHHGSPDGYLPSPLPMAAVLESNGSAALVYAGLGDREATFRALEQAYAARDVHLIYLPVDLKWDPYRTDPRFVGLLTRCGFRPAP